MKVPPPRLDTPALASRRIVVAALLANVVAPPAKAAYGPAGGAVRSSPPLNNLQVDQYLDLSPEKLAQRVGSLSKLTTKELLQKIEQAYSDSEKSALDALVDKLEDERKVVSAASMTSIDKEIADLEDKIKKISRGIEVGKALRAREALNAKLDAQPAWVAYGAAALASCGSTIVAHPIDTFKTLQQAGQEAEHGGTSSDAGRARSVAATDASRTDGGNGGGMPSSGLLFALPPGTKARDLYRGLLPNLVKEAPSSALYLGIYEIVRGQLNGPGGLTASSPLLGYLIAGAVGELAGSVVRAPSEACKTKIQSGIAADVPEAVSQVLIDSEGRRNTLRAWISSIWRDVPMGAVQIAIFESIKAFLIQSPDFDLDVNTLQAEAAFGALGGLVGALLTTPADVVTTRILTRLEGDGSASAEIEEPIGALATAREIYAQEGLAGFTRGMVSRGLYWTPAIGIFLSLYCSLRQAATTLPPPFT